MALLTKSKYLNGLQSKRLLWYAVNKKEMLPVPDASTQFRFDQGHLVGEYAKKCFLGGVDMPTSDFMGNINATKDAIVGRETIFEAGIMVDGLYSRVDVLRPVEDGLWDIIEVKSGTTVKEENIHDVSFQRYCLEKAGLKIRKCHLMHINNQYVRRGEIDPQELFKIEDITEKVTGISEGIDERIADMFKVIKSSEPPACDIGGRCSSPYDCPLTPDCWKDLPEMNVFDLYWGKKKAEEWYGQGIMSLKDIPEEGLNEKQKIQVRAVKEGKAQINKEKIAEFFNKLKMPLNHLDFETFNTAIPPYDGLRPYQQVPFQFSLHIQGTEAVEHKEFLADGTKDPRKEFIEKLKEYIPDVGNVVVFNKSFEIGRLRELSDTFPEHSEWIGTVIDRIKDLAEPFQHFFYHHPDQKGSYSLKVVLPVLTGKSYEGLGIKGGQDASLSYLSLMNDEHTDEEKKKIREDLLAYCGLDTKSMVWIVDELKKKSE